MREWLAQAKTKETDEEFRKAVLYGISEEATAFFADDAPEKYGFEKRDGQLDMAYDILDALRGRIHKRLSRVWQCEMITMATAESVVIS